MAGGKKRFWAGVALSGALSLLLTGLVVSDVPLGVSGEWRWERAVGIQIPVFEILAIAIFWSVAAVVAWWTDCHLSSRYGRCAGVGLILLCGLIVDYQILLSGRAGVNENMLGIIDKYTSGYLAAALTIESPVKYFADFTSPENERRSTPEHVDVHPPGNVLASWLALKSCEQSAGLRRLVAWAMPPGSIDKVATENGVAAAYTSALLALLMLGGITLAKGAILASALIWAQNKLPRPGMAALTLLGAPGAVLFIGHYDPTFFLLTALCCLFFALATTSSRHVGWWAGICGFMLGVGTVFTMAYGVLIIMFFGSGLVMTGMVEQRARYWRILAAMAAGGLGVALLCYLCGFNIIGIFLQCLHNQARFHAETGRSAAWTLFNFFDFILFLGPPGVILPLLLLAERAAALPGGIKDIPGDRILLFALFYLALLTLMCLSPLTRGEMGRLLIFYMPAPLVLSSIALLARPAGRGAAIAVAAVAALLLAQTVTMRVVLKLVIAI